MTDSNPPGGDLPNYPGGQGGNPYGQPPVGGYPPFPPGQDPYASYGAPDPAGQFSVVAALKYGWKKFSANAGVWIGFVLLIFLVSLVVAGPGLFLEFSAAMEGSTPSLGASIVGAVVMAIVSALVQAAFVAGTLEEVDGRKATFGAFFSFRNTQNVLITAAIIAAAGIVGGLLGLIPFIGTLLAIIISLAISLLTVFTIQFVIDQNQDAATALKSGIDLVKNNLGPVILLVLAKAALTIVAACLCLVPLVVAIPVTAIASTYAYRVLAKGPVSPVA